jgi:hypothetical protein
MHNATDEYVVEVVVIDIFSFDSGVFNQNECFVLSSDFTIDKHFNPQNDIICRTALEQRLVVQEVPYPQVNVMSTPDRNTIRSPIKSNRFSKTQNSNQVRLGMPLWSCDYQEVHNFIYSGVLIGSCDTMSSMDIKVNTLSAIVEKLGPLIYDYLNHTNMRCLNMLTFKVPIINLESSVVRPTSQSVPSSQWIESYSPEMKHSHDTSAISDDILYPSSSSHEQTLLQTLHSLNSTDSSDDILPFSISFVQSLANILESDWTIILYSHSRTVIKMNDNTAWVVMDNQGCKHDLDYNCLHSSLTAIIDTITMNSNVHSSQSKSILELAYIQNQFNVKSSGLDAFIRPLTPDLKSSYQSFPSFLSNMAAFALTMRTEYPVTGKKKSKVASYETEQ